MISFVEIIGYAMNASEPAIAYQHRQLQMLRDRLKSTIDSTNDQEKLQACLDILEIPPMPCIYTDEEFTHELAYSEASGNATPQEVNTFLDRWKVIVHLTAAE